MITFICDSSAEKHLIENIKKFELKSLTLREDLSGVNRIKVEIIVSNKELSKVIDYLRENYLKQYNGSLVCLTNYYTY
jgi:hypothetical protein